MAWRLVLRLYVSFMPLFARFVRGFVGLLLLSVHFIVVWRLPALRLLCAAVSALCPVVFWRRFVFLHFCVINWSFPWLDGLFYVICLSLPLIAHFCDFLTFFFVRFVRCLSFFALFGDICVFFNVSFCRWFVSFCANLSSLLISVFAFFFCRWMLFVGGFRFYIFAL